MEHTRVRKIPSKPYPLPGEKWDDGWLDPILNIAKRFAAYSIQALRVSTSRLARWSEPAFIVGGILWCVLLVLLYLDWTSVRLDRSDLPIDWYLLDWNLQLNLQPLIIPMLLFIIGLIGIYSRFPGRLNWPGKAGILLSIVGLVMSALTTWGFRVDTVLWWFTNLVNSDNESYGGFDNIIMEPTFFWLVSEAFTDGYLGFAVLSAGLLLLSIAIFAIFRSKSINDLCSYISFHCYSIYSSAPLADNGLRTL